RALIAARWTQLTWGLYNWLSSAKAVTLTLVVFTAVAMLASTPRYRRSMMLTGVLLLGAYWFVVSPLFSIPATRLLTHFVPQDTGQTVDAIVVLARPREAEGDRYHSAVTLFEAGRADQLLIMGQSGARRVFAELEQRHLATDRLTSAVCARTTKHEAELAVAALGDQGFKRILLLTDQPHMLRAWLTFKGFGFTVTPWMEPLPNWVAHHERSFLAIREYLGLISYALLGRLQAPEPGEFNQLVAQARENYPPQYCFMTADQIRQSLLGQARAKN
ncbi:MAG TPA: YdcF family protein, partial [Leptolyngbyaceae cyanobacterium M65_K2018_010]|nr:YdcF family protein [Leptolyngbyaceae cyanobacterium M65_K2018_010]